MSTESNYHSYLLQLCAPPASERVVLMPISGAGESLAFPSLEALFTFLLSELAEARAPPPQSDLDLPDHPF